MNDEEGVPQEILEWVKERLGRDVERGFGYISWAFLSRDSVLKIDRAKGHTERFSFDRFIAESLLPVPGIQDYGSILGHSWIHMNRLQGIPAYLKWLGMSHKERKRFLAQLLEVLREFHSISVPRRVIPKPSTTWADRLKAKSVAVLNMSRAAVPADYYATSEAFFKKTLNHVSEHPYRLVHGDLWLGNVLIGGTGELTGLLDFDKVELAPGDYELAALVRFWRYPWSFVPEELEPAFQASLEFNDIAEIAQYCIKDLGKQELATRLSVYELTYRLRKAAEFGWSSTHARQMDNVLDGSWSDLLLEAID